MNNPQEKRIIELTKYQLVKKMIVFHPASLTDKWKLTTTHTIENVYIKIDSEQEYYAVYEPIHLMPVFQGLYENIELLQMEHKAPDGVKPITRKEKSGNKPGPDLI